MIELAVAVQMKGLGSTFDSLRKCGLDSVPQLATPVLSRHQSIDLAML